MKHIYGSKTATRVAALALAMLLGLGAPASAAGLWSWLTGQPEATEAAAIAAATATAEPAPGTVTLSPVDTLWSFEEDGATAAPEATIRPTPAPIAAASIEDDGLLRVELRSLGAPAQLHLTLAGVYAVEGDPGFRFDRGTRLAISAAGDNVYLAVGGLTLNMGPSFTLTRHRAEAGAENGIYIDEAEQEALYCGDLKIAASGTALRAVLTIQAEDYLYGVVAYEMSDSFPIEALKAQAVAARTYAMQRKWQAGSRDYDLVDTTADQVFKGYRPEYANVLEAVDATRGVVGLYDGGFAICYYTASNGGQTALPSQVWGSADGDGYLAMADDPYDLENPRSLQNELTVTARCEGSAALRSMLESALGAQMRAAGVSDGEWALDSIASIAPANPRFEGSRMYEDLEFSLRVKLLLPVETPTPRPTDAPTPAPTQTPAPSDAATGAPRPSEAAEAQAALALAAAFTGDAMPTAPDEPLETEDAAPGASDAPQPTPTPPPREWVLSGEEYSVTLSVYDQIKDGLSLGLNGSDCELISVETEADEAGAPSSFTLIMRRFGHGVGMSQRGAQWMAGEYGLLWQEILAFYYPGLELRRMDWPEQALTDLAALPDGVGAARPKPTATPTPAPLPALQAGERYAVVTATSLNVREQPTTAARAVAQLAQGRRVIVASEPDADGWVSVHTAEVEGYVKAEYLETAD